MFIISEIFPQHSGNLDMAKRMIHLSQLGGASAVKFQLVQKNMFSHDKFDRSYNELKLDELKLLVNYSRDIGVKVFATAFTEETLDWCVKLDLDYLKIPARMHKENPNLIKKILKIDKKTFVSVRPEEVKDLDFSKNKNLIFLSCISKYPTMLSEVILPDFKNSQFQGISDHSLGIAAALKSCSLGATYLEKHFTFNKNMQKNTEKGHLGSMDYEDLVLLKRLTMEIEEIGKIPKKI